LDKEIVGVSTHCDYPQGVKTKEKIGTFSDPNIERIVSLKPDVIFCTGLEQASIINKLKQLKLNIHVSDPTNMKELFASIIDIGKETGREKQARTLIIDMQKDIDSVTKQFKGIPKEKRPRVFVEIWNDPLMTAGKSSFLDELIDLAGGTNIAGIANKAFTHFSPEQVIKQDPECIILTYMYEGQPIDLFKKRLGWQGISAVRNKCVYSDIDPNILLRPGPRITKGLKEVHNRLYKTQGQSP
ncbi:MAG: ABC transporter substrate-binding protein, partial [Candidatus Omnitrophica bacterium]|nr:ABC transporter substrate-binding protein [Candidatus Omnitrophota bacterium]